MRYERLATAELSTVYEQTRAHGVQHRHPAGKSCVCWSFAFVPHVAGPFLAALVPLLAKRLAHIPFAPHLFFSCSAGLSATAQPIAAGAGAAVV